MCIENIKKRIYDDEYACCNPFEIEDCEKYAMCKAELVLKFEGLQNCNQCKKAFESIDISKYLDAIKDKEKEYVLLIAIHDTEIETFCFSGNKDSIDASAYFVKGENVTSAVEFIAKWHKRRAKICNYHNHTLRIAAIPSNQDIESMDCLWSHISWDECVKKYGIDIPHDFHFADWGVVTPYDFFSQKQYEEKGGKVRDLIVENNERKKLIDAELLKYMADI